MNMANFNFNKVILGGRLTDSVELKNTNSGTIYASFTIAISRAKDGVDFIECIAWRKTAEFIHQYFGRGSSICVVGTLQTRSYEGRDGTKRKVTEVVVSEASFVDSKAERSSMPDEPKEPQFEDVTEDDDLPF